VLSPFLQHVDLYCERLGPGLWAEPINAISNLAFFIAGLWGISAVRRAGAGRAAEVLAWWVVAIGVGSTLFHTFANRLTIWADILPIATFTLAYTIFALRRFLHMAWPQALALFVGFYAVAGLLSYLVPDSLRVATNGTTGYLPALLALLFFGGLFGARGSAAGRYCLAAAVLFVAAVTCRMTDPVVCPSLPIGTHFLWHVFNGAMLAVLLASVARFGAPRR